GLDRNRALIVPGWRNRLLALSPRLAPRWLVRRLAALRTWAKGRAVPAD
ncbi:hypothetical protein ACV35C_30540, partial [Pseudomonas aeruginosa]